MKVTERVLAIADKEWRLNLRFPMEYIATNVVNPFKSAVVMYFLYRGLLTTGDHSLGVLNRATFPMYVVLGSTCHSLFMASLYTFRTKMVSEKYWQTITATLVSPASILEVIAGFIIGSVGIHLVISSLIVGVVSWFFNVPFSVFATSILLLLLISLLGFGFGLIGTTFSLVWEGKAFLFDYSIQGLIFLSCFYYPLETLPRTIHPLVKLLPTYQAGQMIQHLFIFGSHPNFVSYLSMLTVGTLFILCLPAFFLDYSIKKYGIVGY